ncbi:MAG: hypothetical protein ACLPX9_20750 [Rhodomicrobium sp.]
MRSKGQASVKGNGEPIVYNGVECESHLPDGEPNVSGALQTNIQESFDEIEILRGSLQYWESRRPAADPKERAMLAEAFRVLHGELIGLTARAKELVESVELANKG